MPTSRRSFIGKTVAGVVALGGVSGLPGTAEAIAATASTDWDLSWVKRISAKHRALFDVPEIESGYGVWRAALWGAQYQQVLGISPRDISTVIILRHNGIALAMQQSYWDAYAVGREKKVTHPVTMEATDRSPVLLSSKRKEVPADFDALSLDSQIARGAIVLACDLALRDCVDTIAKKDGLPAEAARAKAIGMMVPGVILQPSGVFAAVRAQEAGCHYVRAS
jgi:hypothetical protein